MFKDIFPDDRKLIPEKSVFLSSKLWAYEVETLQLTWKQLKDDEIDENSYRFGKITNYIFAFSLE